MLLGRQTLVDGGWVRGPPCPRWELVKPVSAGDLWKGLKNTARHAHSCQYVLSNYLVFEYTFPTRFLTPSEWQITPESSVGKAAGPTTAAEVGSSGHTLEALKKATRVSPLPTPNSSPGWIPTLSLSDSGGLWARWEAAGQTYLNLGDLFYFHFACLWNVISDLYWPPHPTPSSFPLKFEVSLFQQRVRAYGNQYRFPVTRLSQGKNWMCVLQTLSFIVQGRFTGEVTWCLLGKHCCQKKEENGFGL